jgi:hypothetical protein
MQVNKNYYVRINFKLNQKQGKSNGINRKMECILKESDGIKNGKVMGLKRRQDR